MLCLCADGLCFIGDQISLSKGHSLGVVKCSITLRQILGNWPQVRDKGKLDVSVV